MVVLPIHSSVVHEILPHLSAQFIGSRGVIENFFAIPQERFDDGFKYGIETREQIIRNLQATEVVSVHNVAQEFYKYCRAHSISLLINSVAC